MQDYQQNRKTPGPNTFGQSAFGGTTQPASTTNLFGQSAQPQPANSIFNSFGNAGANNTTTGGVFGGMGQTPTQGTGGFGTFNQASQQPAQQPATSSFGSFNQPQQPQNTGLFGGSNAFGTQNKPPGGFGMSCNLSFSLTYHVTGSTSGFGSGTNTGSTGLFGQTNTAQQQSAPTSLFGQNQPTSNAFGGSAFSASRFTIGCVLPLTRLQQVRTMLARSHPYSGRPINNSLRPVAALVCLDLSSSRPPKVKPSKVLPDSLGISQRLDRDRQIQPRRDNHNRVDVRYHYYLLSESYQRNTQYLAIPRHNNLLPDCLVVPEEAVCLGTRSSKVVSSKQANRLPLDCLGTRQPLQQRGAESLATMLQAKQTRLQSPSPPAFSEAPLDSQHLNRQTTPLEVEPISLAARPHLPLV